MKRIKCNKIRTVTEIVNSNEKVQKTYELAEFDLKNLSSLESYETLKIKLALSKYMAMLSTLEMTQPLLEIFRNKADTRQIAAVVFSTLAFIHNRFHPLVTNFTNKMEFVVTETNDTSIPGEPILFTENEGVLLCSVDRVSIVKMLSREFDTDTLVNFESDNCNVRIAKTFGATKRKNAPPRTDDYERSHDMDLSDFSITEIETTQYLTLLLTVEHAYLHYYIFKNYGVFEYCKSLTDHSLFTNKLRSTMSTKTSNLLLSKFKFTIEDFDKINSNSVTSGFNIYNFNK
ncbi:odv-ec27 protein [Thysanoplusia orichalcea nucleopolyhedrovirus]|uniref:Odv-ec27 protein n=1 Tax=Thysanoplusia orichalcea nucleopolyhedrovirus TaxID=101850 RepID=L0CM37_9ABAC|nr:odv-ec27 protein [Thysanoplusia orichalcea nucleopolyhedrovirus]AGA16291.1 odv-ec27 protein [Thysanoplusia orichalcea nucleopolyhedrovirus]